MLLHATAEGLNIGPETAETHDDVVLHFEDSLEIVGESEHLLAEPSVSSYSHAVLSDHSHDCATIVLEYAHNLKVIQILSQNIYLGPPRIIL